MLTAVIWVFALLLTAAGARKITQPAATGAALQVAKLPSDERLVRGLGAGEVGLGVAVLTLGGPIPVALLAVAYAAFAAFAEYQRRKSAACGCFGATATPATSLHVGLNVIAAALATASAVQPGAPLPATMADDPFLGFLVAVLLVVAASLLQVVLTAAPDLTAAIALVEPGSDT